MFEQLVRNGSYMLLKEAVRVAAEEVRAWNKGVDGRGEDGENG